MQGARFWVDADCEVNIRVKEGLITENGGPGKAKVRHGDDTAKCRADGKGLQGSRTMRPALE